MRTLVVTLLVLALAAVGADRVAERVAADRAEKRLVAEGLRQPRVDVHGFPFLTQLLARRFSDVQVTAAGIDVAAGTASDITVTGHDVSVPRGAGRADIGSLRASGVVPYAEVLRQAGARGVKLGPAGAGTVKLVGTAQVLGQTLPVAAIGRVQAAGRSLRIVPTSFEAAGTNIGGAALAAALRDRFTLTYSLRKLPQGVELRDVTAGPGGFLVTLSGQDVSVASGS